jgi:hypothetical protein
MDRASQVLAQSLSSDMRRTYAALAEYSEVALPTLHHRARSRCSREEKDKANSISTHRKEKARREVFVTNV